MMSSRDLWLATSIPTDPRPCHLRRSRGRDRVSQPGKIKDSAQRMSKSTLDRAGCDWAFTIPYTITHYVPQYVSEYYIP